MIESALTVLPEPDSPTSATVSPLPMVKETRFTACVTFSPLPKSTDRLRTFTRVSEEVTKPPSSECLAGIECVAHRLADEDQQRQCDGHGEEAGEAEPRRFEVLLALQEQLTERRGAGGEA